MEHGGRPGRRAVPGAVVAAGAVAALAVAALVLRPEEGLLDSDGKGPLGHWGFVAIGASVAWAVAVMKTVQRLRPRFNSYRASLPPGEERLREIAAPLLFAGAGVIGVLALVLHRFSTGGDQSSPPPVLPAPLPTQPVPGEPMPGQDRADPGHDASLPLYLVLGLLAAVVVVLVVVAVVRRLRRLGLRVPQRPARAAPVTEDDDARLLLSAVRSGRRALADTGDARAAVIACYAGMEDALVASGVARHASDSPADLLDRAVTAGLAPGPAAPRLTALFREARFSSHPMDASHREAAADALEEIDSLLAEREGAR
ncbi:MULTISPECIES: DUF4129 domain-containing protein [unclassified Streptomyces]|uniref:DUF4129 domain-containing protein n=1 Tax=unclassified Streptomyces TaxID=2593676 RepID=UPI00234A0C60|nr:DUF4129 domain-containing protein [Streptomyces sp. M92]WCN03942.1 DUF4129 domain-containing protein [Streptomyces sp. M92]